MTAQFETVFNPPPTALRPLDLRITFVNTMSTASHTVQGSQPGISLQEQPRPPPIHKPKTSKHNLTNGILQESFKVEYYLSKTGNWEHIKMAAVVQIFKTCCDSPLKKHSPELEPAIKGFKHQSERLKDKIYEGFIENLRAINLKSEDFREVLFDILESTSEERWFFVWIVGQTLRAWQKKEESASRKAESSKRERRDPLAIDELIN
ncbi:hypothetical protein TWF481_006231 [Arthrobotrys musiformis]|uniref:SRA1/Sec31 domain-containing protein n=1 Tax=Arthrobotrys musiformis TaxID=47236 RepID=A0AAV9WHG5_9PEZI